MMEGMTAMYKYAIEIFYSEEDEGYIANVPELPGCSAFGNTEEESLEEVKIAMELWLKTDQKEGTKIPQSHGKELLKELIEKQHFQTTYGELA
jgi:predicted RNase H-like HicB family nuclease